ncbi:uncharacterized protein LOC106646648 [Copidosoma floridanum]|uniref:uncharacterized protein LOC106646648 n=1 Tax=Copidosoma floridanum TaxID=29053 RepID=UPI0006C9E5CB|nr:uncharacterized protein LOC106646648 [Copidosoma floridanum]
MKFTSNDMPRNSKICCVRGCPTKKISVVNGGPIKCYYFPSENIEHRRERRRVWIEIVKKQCEYDSDWQPKKTHRICSLHFVGGLKSEHPYHPGYNPTIFPGKTTVKTEIKATARLARFQRYIKRNPVTLPLQYEYKKNKRTLKPSNVMDTNNIKLEDLSQTDCVDGIVKCIPQYSDFSSQVNFIDNIDYFTGTNFIVCNRIIEDHKSDAETLIFQLH